MLCKSSCSGSFRVNISWPPTAGSEQRHRFDNPSIVQNLGQRVGPEVLTPSVEVMGFGMKGMSSVDIRSSSMFYLEKAKMCLASLLDKHLELL